MASNFRDIPPNLQFTANKSVRRNAAGNAFETYTPASITDLSSSITTAIDALTSDDIEEGASNLYFTNERAQDAVAAALTNSDTIQFTYTDGSNQIQAEVIVPNYALRLDDASPVTYVGEALPGTAESAPAWRIKKITETGSDIDIEWADGAATFTKVWDDRLSLSYA